MWKRSLLIGGVLVVVLGGVAATSLASEDDYEVDFVVPSAAQLLEGSFVWIDGQEAGEVRDLEVRDGKAIVTAAFDAAHAPLHEGTSARVEWQSVLGERIFSVDPGPADNAEIPSGAMYEGEVTQIEVDQVLAALDEQTREELTSLLRGLNRTVDGNEDDLQATLAEAGPAVRALGEVLDAVGQDGPAIRRLVQQLEDMVGVLAEQHGDVSGVVENLTGTTGRLAEQRDNVAEGLGELPDTLDAARETLDDVPEAVDAAVPLLEDFGPASERLTSVSRNLSPVLSDLRPTVAELRPTLEATQVLLDHTPGLLDSAHGVLPQVARTMNKLHPAVAHLRPYLPEAVGWINNWGRDYASYDSQGHVWLGGLAQAGLAAMNDQPPGGTPPMSIEEPPPGEVVDQPWTDAHGSEMR
ncbi:phospholipid/cholesterol/gamma-HCH transport system substrate-binding protein [Haloechinothrix alba]|uniref:Phospholipid/cholesterol/gamma-HCH transport system substrate-binding protein n=1 Tax=Haloechinothrix alba TaxID=664784 RepID=A0A238Y4N1_9PSEU|nr:MlaD family protein [Haloechinothrix alba]SNR65942.1 phospholipid/cholesterol/gamma-HCH transport system substrate-binding protein [Haloechinothrix alba]